MWWRGHPLKIRIHLGIYLLQKMLNLTDRQAKYSLIMLLFGYFTAMVLDCSGIQVKHQKRLRLQLSALETAQMIENMDLPGYRLHKLKGERKNLWSITVNGNWRLTFKFIEGDVYVVNYEDYH